MYLIWDEENISFVNKRSIIYTMQQNLFLEQLNIRLDTYALQFLFFFFWYHITLYIQAGGAIITWASLNYNKELDIEVVNA